jgi:hypothetical protein
VHEAWADFFGATFKDDPRYNVADCFEPFPFPVKTGWEADFETGGREYYQFREALMRRNSEGLTKTYNQFHDPSEDDPAVLRLRELHNAMDRAVLDAYSWTDIPTNCEFFAEFDEEEDEDESGRPRRKKYRYRWPDEIRDKVLARLLELNRQRALEEGQLPTLADAADPEPEKKAMRKKAGRRASEDLNLSLLPQEETWQTP